MKKVLAIALATIMVLSLAGCGAAASATPEQKEVASEAVQAAAEAAKEVVEEKKEEAAPAAAAANFTKAADIVPPAGKTPRSLPIDEASEKPIRIATAMVQNNPFGAAVIVGQEFAKEALADRNCTVDILSVSSFDTMDWVSTMENAIANGYDAICFMAISDEMVPTIELASKSNIPVFLFNCDCPDTDRIAWYGQDGTQGGQACGQAIVDALPDGGKYAIITGDFSVSGHELRRLGARSVLDPLSKFENVGEYQNNDDAEQAYSLTTDILNANPDIAAIYVTAGGPSGAAQAIVDAGKKGEVVLVCHDCLQAVADYIADGTILKCIDQDPFNQGCQPVIDAYNYLVGGVVPEEINFYEPVIAEPGNVKQLFPEFFE